LFNEKNYYLKFTTFIVLQHFRYATPPFKGFTKVSIKTMQLIPAGKENWRISPGAMSSADIAYHLIQTDDWLFKKIKLKDLKSIKGSAGAIEIKTRNDYIKLIEELNKSGEKRAGFILSLDDKVFQEKIYDDRFGKEVSVWWIIVRGNLDHEIHHRGQLSSYLRAIDTQLLDSN
jgi:uncharacterized damage-inducible protein DinB